MTKRLAAILLTLFWSSALLTVACATNPPPKPPTSPATKTGALRAVATTVRDSAGRPAANVSCGLHVGAVFVPASAPSNADGYVLWNEIPASQKDTDIQCTGDGFVTFTEHRSLHTEVNEDLTPDVAMTSTHVDPSTFSYDEVVAYRGAMWPSVDYAGLPYGPRPGAVGNILATTAWNCYTKEQRDTASAWMHAHGYTHVVYGPFVNESYHGQYCSPTNNWDTFLDDLQDLWDRGFKVNVFLKPDGWGFEQTRDYFTPLLSQPRAKKLFRLVNVHGWESWSDGYNVSSCTFALYVSWLRDLLGPDVVLWTHNATRRDGSAPDAPVGTDALCNDNGNPNGQGWQNLVDAGLDGWFIQTGPADHPPDAVKDKEWCAMWDAGEAGAFFHSIAWHFVKGIGGFPTTTRRGKKFLLIDGEGTAFNKYWGANGITERIAEQWGDFAMHCGADGYGDGGTVAVR